MIGIVLASIGTLFEEVSSSIGKFAVNHHRQSMYTMGFLHLISGVIFFAVILFFNHNFVFSVASLPTFIPRVILEIVQLQVGMLALVQADRSTFGLLRTGTIPLLLCVDLFLGYPLSSVQIIGIILIIITISVLLFETRINKKGIGWVLFSTINAVTTISLYKYNITHFNSVEAEQSIIYVILLIYVVCMAYVLYKENPFTFLRKKLYLLQSVTQGAGGILESFAYIFAPASIILAAKRSSAVLWSVLSGNKYFHEHHFSVKIIAFAVLTIGIFLLFL